MQIETLIDNLEEIADQLRVHMQASPLDDIIESALTDLEHTIDEVGGDL